jgi:hypothetical protein
VAFERHVRICTTATGGNADHLLTPVNVRQTNTNIFIICYISTTINPGAIPFVTYALIRLNLVVLLGFVDLFGNATALAIFYHRALIPARTSSGQNLYSLIS